KLAVDCDVWLLALSRRSSID
ncbi:hypothetical protein AVEN_13390-1, partial [Araneus ventricosus]